MGLGFLQPILVYTLIAAVWMSSSGVSLVAVRLSDEMGVAAATADFPCAGHSCGCISAEMCRAHCCCYPSPPKPKPEPQTESCHLPANSELESAEDSGDPVNDEQDDEILYRLVVRSAECAGLTAWLLANSLYVPVQNWVAVDLTWPLVAVLPPTVPHPPASISLSPDPRPPRPC